MEKLGNTFNQVSIPLKYTPRQFALHQTTRTFVVVESDHATYSSEEKSKGLSIKEQEGFEIDQDMINLDPAQFGHVRNSKGKWASCIRLIEPFQGETLQEIELEENEAAFSVAAVQFANNPHAGDAMEQFIVVGTGKDVTLAPRGCASGYLRLYRPVLAEDQRLQLELIHKTPVEEIPYALTSFHGRLLAGIGKTLRIYDVGRKKMLRKCEARVS